MRVTCQTCQAKYTIADEKVAGKVVKIKCKKCGSTIVVNGNDPASAAPPGLQSGPSAAGEEEEGDTKVFVDPAGASAADSASADDWTVNVTDDDQRTMTTPQIVQEIAAGVVTADTYVWKDGMADWLPASEVPELASFLASAPPASPPATASDVGFSGGAVAGKSPSVSPFSAAAPASGAISPASAGASGAARRSGVARGKVDLFGASKEPVAAAPPPAALGPSHVGERNENSVLFSLSALTATENAAKAAPKKPDQGAIDLRPSKPKNGGRGNFDDIMNLGGGGIGGGMTSPALAPPPLLAPVVEAPVRPAAPAFSAPTASVASSMPAPPKKGGAGLIVGILVVLGLAGGAAFFFLKSGGSSAPAPIASPDSTSATVAPTASAATPVDTATAAAAETAAPTTPSATPDATAAPSGVAAATVVAAATGTKAGASSPSAAPSTKPASQPATPPPAETAAAAPPAGGSGAEFSRSAAASALGAAAGNAKGCKKADGPTGSGRVKVTFAPSGNVTTATVDGPPFSGTPMGGCIASAFRGAHVPPFDGSPVTVTKSFNIN